MRFTDDVRNAHTHSSRNRRELEASEICGCFYCLATFKTVMIERWLQEGDGTAICPECDIDSVIGSASGYPVTPEFLEKMHRFWFEETSSLEETR